MNTIILEQPGAFRFCQTVEPAAPPAGHALVRVRCVGMCGTDWNAYRGRQPFFSYPRILGHELGVEIETVNDPSSDLRPGDRCSVDPYLNCGTCIACRRGKPNCCVRLLCLGVHTDGGMRERIILPVPKLHRSCNLSFDQLALVETLGVGCHAVSRAGVEKGEWVLVLGAGPIGLAAATFAQAAGGQVIVADVSASRLDFCRKHLGLRHILDGSKHDVLAVVKDLTHEDLPTVVIDATGNAASMTKAFEYIAHGGRIVFVGLHQGEITFSDPHLHRREITLLASRNSTPPDFTRIISLVEDGTVDTRPWITHRTECAKLPEVLPQWVAPDAGVVKAVVQF